MPIPHHLIYAANEIGRCADNLDSIVRTSSSIPDYVAAAILDTVRDLISTWNDYRQHIIWAITGPDSDQLDNYLICPDCHPAPPAISPTPNEDIEV